MLAVTGLKGWVELRPGSPQIACTLPYPGTCRPTLQPCRRGPPPTHPTHRTRTPPPPPTTTTTPHQHPLHQVGLASLSAAVQRSGGSVAHPGAALDEALEERAASIEGGASGEAFGFGFQCLREDAADVLGLFAEVGMLGGDARRGPGEGNEKAGERSEQQQARRTQRLTNVRWSAHHALCLPCAPARSLAAGGAHARAAAGQGRPSQAAGEVCLWCCPVQLWSRCCCGLLLLVARGPNSAPCGCLTLSALPALVPQVLNALEHRNDNPSGIPPRELAKMIYGRGSVFARDPTPEQVGVVFGFAPPWCAGLLSACAQRAAGVVC